jgi:hypothetical protein
LRACFPLRRSERRSLVDRRRLDVAGSVCLEDRHHRLLGSVVVVVVVFRRVPVPSFAPDKQFFKLLQMLHYRDSTRVSKDILVLLLLFLLFLLLCPTPYFSPSLDFHFVCMFLLTSPSFSVIFCFVSVSDSAVALFYYC